MLNFGRSSDRVRKFYSFFHSWKESVIQLDNIEEKIIIQYSQDPPTYFLLTNKHTYTWWHKGTPWCCVRRKSSYCSQYSMSLFISQNSVGSRKCIERKGVNKMLMHTHGEIRTGEEVLTRVLGTLPMGSLQQKGDGRGMPPFCTHMLTTTTCLSHAHSAHNPVRQFLYYMRNFKHINMYFDNTCKLKFSRSHQFDLHKKGGIQSICRSASK